MKLMKLLALGLFAIMFAAFLVPSALALGVAPATWELDYTPNVQQKLTLQIINNEEKEVSVSVNPEGDLAEYVSFETSNIVSFKLGEREKKVNIFIDLLNQ